MATQPETRSVAVLSTIPELATALAELLPGLNFLRIGSVDSKAIAQLKEVDIIVSDVALLGPVIYELKKVKWVQATSAGVDVLLKYVNYNQPPLHYPIVRFTGVHFGRMMSEYIVTYIVSHERDLAAVAKNQLEKKWSHDGKIKNYRVICDLTIGVLGLGTIGCEIAKCLKLLGAKIWGLVRTSPQFKADFVDEYRQTDQIADLFRVSDYIISVLPDTDETKGLLTLELFSVVKSGGIVFMNVGRGSVVSDNNLIAAIESGYITAAILDVFNSEPLPPDNPLWSMPQVTITPHTSAVSRAKDIANVFAENYTAWKTGKPLPDIFQLSRGY